MTPRMCTRDGPVGGARGFSHVGPSQDPEAGVLSFSSSVRTGGAQSAMRTRGLAGPAHEISYEVGAAYSRSGIPRGVKLVVHEAVDTHADDSSLTCSSEVSVHDLRSGRGSIQPGVPGYQNVLYGDNSVRPHGEGYYTDPLDAGNYSVEGQAGVVLYYWSRWAAGRLPCSRDARAGGTPFALLRILTKFTRIRCSV